MLQHERIAGLKRVPIFAKLSDEALERVARSCAWSQHESGEEILSFQDPSTDVLFLLAGRARVVIHSLEGRAVVFVNLKAGTMFGELAAIDRKRGSARAVHNRFIVRREIRKPDARTAERGYCHASPSDCRRAAAIGARIRVQHACRSESRTC